jgi:hypothetical protein
MTTKKILALTLAVATVIALKARADDPAAALALPEAVFSAQIPVYPGASLESSMGGTSSDELFGPPTAESLSWFFDVEDSAEQVVAFYAGKLTNATRMSEDAETTFEFVPAGAEAGESVTVTVGQGRLQITEVVKPGKRTS